MTSPVSDQPPSGLVAGKYQLVRLIGRGGMGSVWEARNVSIGTRFAIKFIEAEYADSQEARGRFIREARAAATIESKHLIRIYDHGHTDDGKPFIVMELLQGEPLDKRIERLGKLPLDETARILLQVGRGLARAHEAGIVHRDLKPENIFLTHSPDDDHEIAKVLDFGIAKIQSPDGNAPSGLTSGTKTGAVLGTPFYMSPEQARGLRNVDHRTDLWSLGVIAFKCVTGRLPFDGESVGDLLVKICTAPPPVPSQIEPSLPRAFDAWFARALDREPERRFQNALELASVLAAAAGIAAPGSSYGAGTPIASLPAVSGRPPNVSAGAYDATAHTPPPGGLTGAPFTAPVPGVPTPGRGKVILVAALAGLLVAGGGTALAITKMRGRQRQAIGITPPPATSSAEPPPATSAEKVAEPTPAPTPEPKPEPKIDPKAGTGTKVPTTPVGKLPTVKPAVSTAPTTPPSAVSSTPKKPPPPPPGGGTRPKDDPGY